MKKHLIAAAVAAGVAAPAIAQNVTISGTFDGGIVVRDSGNATANKFTGGAGGVLTTNTLRFSGTEDLGGGLKAGFTILDEYDLKTAHAATATVASDATAANGPMSSVDQYSINVSGDFGAFEIGRFPSLARSINGAGSVIGNIGLPGNYGANNGVTAVDANVAVVTAGERMSMRVLGNYANNSVAYTTPTFNGVTAQIYRSFANRAADDAGQVDAVGVRYSAGPLTLGYSNIKQVITTAGAKRDTDALSAQYDFGMVVVGVASLTHDESSAVVGEDAKLNMVTARVPLSGGVSLIGGYHLFKDAGATASNKATAIMLGAIKDLSKRTNVYAAYGKVSNESNASYHLGAMDIGVSTAGNDPKVFSVGMRHSF